MHKIELLWTKLPKDRPFNSHEVREIGREMFFESAERRVRKMAEEGKLRRIPVDECILKGFVKKGNAPLAWWEVC